MSEQRITLVGGPVFRHFDSPVEMGCTVLTLSEANTKALAAIQGATIEDARGNEQTLGDCDFVLTEKGNRAFRCDGVGLVLEQPYQSNYLTIDQIIAVKGGVEGIARAFVSRHVVIGGSQQKRLQDV